MMNVVYFRHFRSSRSVATKNNDQKFMGITVGKIFPYFDLKINFQIMQKRKQMKLLLLTVVKI